MCAFNQDVPGERPVAWFVRSHPFQRLDREGQASSWQIQVPSSLEAMCALSSPSLHDEDGHYAAARSMSIDVHSDCVRVPWNWRVALDGNQCAI